MSLEKIDVIITALRKENYRWKPAKRVYIPKKMGKKRPLGVTTWSDKLVAEVVRMILDAYFDVQFSNHSHGFRRKRGCGTALREIYHTWTGRVWIIEGDISDCFGSLPHDLLISTLSEKIHDGRFIRLIRRLLDAGYLEDWKVRFVRSKPWQHGGKAAGKTSLTTNFLMLGVIPNLLDGQQTAVSSP